MRWLLSDEAGRAARDDTIGEEGSVAAFGDNCRRRRSKRRARHISSVRSTPEPSTALHTHNSWLAHIHGLTTVNVN